jgi:aromatic-L-amino-acid decarboxylase
MTPEEFRRAGHALIDWLADYRSRVQAGEVPVATPVKPGELLARLPAQAPEAPEAIEQILADLDRLILPGLVHWQHPSFHGFFPSNASLASVLGDLASTGLGVLGLSWEASPALTELEQACTDWLRDLLGLSPAFSGVLTDTASAATHLALVCARERAGGLAGVAGAPLVVYASEQAHSSVAKAARIAGFGPNGFRPIATDAAGRMDPVALASQVASDRAAGLRPCAVVATSGTTATTAFDPIAAIAAVAQAEGLFLHVDAAMGGAAMLLPECRPLWEGVEQADSVVVNPHKWLGVAFDCSLHLVRDPQALVAVLSTQPSYLQSAQDGQVRNYRDWGIALGRRFRALKLWFLLREQGAQALRARLRRDLEHAQRLAAWASETPGWEVMAPVNLQTVCLRHRPAGLAGEALDQHTRDWARRLNVSGRAWVTPALGSAGWFVRVAFGGEHTQELHVQALWEQLQAVTAAAH